MRDKAEKFGSLFLMIFSTGLAGQFAGEGMHPVQWAGAALAVGGSVTLAWMAHRWPARADRRL